VDIGYVGKRRQRALDQAHRRSCCATLVGHNPEQMQRIGVVRVFIEDFAVKRRGLPQPCGLMMGKSGAHGSAGLPFAARLGSLFVALPARSH